MIPTDPIRARLAKYLAWNFGYDPPVWATLEEFQDFIEELELPAEREVVAEMWEEYQAQNMLNIKK
jgi:hypothetical protein